MGVFAHLIFHLLQYKKQGEQGYMEINVSLIHIKWE